MKKTVIILSVFALIASSCGQAMKKQAKNNEVVFEQNNENPVVISEKIDSIFTSPIRPKEKLLAGKIYSDNFEYLDYNDQGDYFFFVVHKDNQHFTLLDGCTEGKVPKLNRGDILEIQWKIDSSWVAGDGDKLDMREWATNIKKTKDGELSIFRNTNKKTKLYYFIDDLDNYTDYGKNSLIDEVEYFLANATDENILQYLNDGTGEIQIYITDYWQGKTAKPDKKGYPTITARVENYAENKYTQLIKLGIEYDNENYYKKTYYQYDEEKNEYIRIEQ